MVFHRVARSIGRWDDWRRDKARIPKNDPRQLRTRALDLKGKVGSFIRETDELERDAETLERKLKKPDEDAYQVAFRAVSELTRDK